MAKEKFTLEDLQVQSLVTTLDEAQMGHVKGGYFITKGRNYTYRTRWTSVDIRTDVADALPAAINQVKH